MLQSWRAKVAGAASRELLDYRFHGVMFLVLFGQGLCRGTNIASELAVGIACYALVIGVYVLLGPRFAVPVLSLAAASLGLMALFVATLEKFLLAAGLLALALFLGCMSCLAVRPAPMARDQGPIDARERS